MNDDDILIDLPDQTCRGCGHEHPGEPCDLQDDLFTEEAAA